MGAGELIDVDVHAHAVVRTLPDLPDIHGVIVVPDKHRVYATATGNNQFVAIDEDSGQVVFRAPTDTYPDGLAYDPIRHTVWTTNECAGTETVIDADTGAVRATVPLGGEVGNVVYDNSSTRWWSRYKAVTTWPSSTRQFHCDGTHSHARLRPPARSGSRRHRPGDVRRL